MDYPTRRPSANLCSKCPSLSAIGWFQVDQGWASACEEHATVIPAWQKGDWVHSRSLVRHSPPCDECGKLIGPGEDLKQTDGDRHYFHVACAPEESSDECEACEAERKGLAFDITSACTGSYCDEHAGEHEDALDGVYCPNGFCMHGESEGSDSKSQTVERRHNDVRVNADTGCR